MVLNHSVLLWELLAIAAAIGPALRWYIGREVRAALLAQKSAELRAIENDVKALKQQRQLLRVGLDQATNAPRAAEHPHG